MQKTKTFLILVSALFACAALADESIKGDTNTTGPFSPSNAGGTTVNTARSASGDAIYPSQSSARRRGAERHNTGRQAEDHRPRRPALVLGSAGGAGGAARRAL